MLRSMAGWALLPSLAGASSSWVVVETDDPDSGDWAAEESALLEDRSPGGEAEAAGALASGGPYTADQIRLGRKLTTAMGCHDCHTPWKFDEKLGAPAPDMTRMLSGHPAGTAAPKAVPGDDTMMIMGATGTSFVMPFGVVYATNLTPDEDTGIGSWTEEMFLNVFRKAAPWAAAAGRSCPPCPGPTWPPWTTRRSWPSTPSCDHFPRCATVWRPSIPPGGHGRDIQDEPGDPRGQGRPSPGSRPGPVDLPERESHPAIP